MAEQRVAYWAAEAEVDEDLEDVDLNLAIGSFGQTDLYEDGAPESQNYVSNDVTNNLRRPSEAPHRRDCFTRCPPADGAASLCPNPRRCEEGSCPEASRDRRLRNNRTVYRTLLPSCPGEQSRRNHGLVRKRMEPTDGEILRQN